MKKIIPFLLYLATTCSVTACSKPKAEVIIGGDKPVTNQYDAWAQQSVDAADRDLKIAGTNGYYENQNRDRTSFIWGNIFLLYTHATGTRLSESVWKPRLMACIANTDNYWTTGYNDKDGYATLPVGAGVGPDRYYDENGWMSIGLCDAYLATGDASQLERAKNALAFTLSGEDDVLGGGIYFQETFSAFQPQKNTICNAVAIVAAMKLYNITKEEEYLTAAKRINKWTLDNLLDHTDNLLWDAKMVRDGSINKTKWSYNAGFMIQGWLLLHQATGDVGYLTQAHKTMAAAENKWFSDKSGALNDPGYFAFSLIDAWYAFYDLTGDKAYLVKAFQAVDFVHNHLKDANGRYSEEWGTAISEPLTAWDLRFLTVVAYVDIKAACYKQKYND